MLMVVLLFCGAAAAFALWLVRRRAWDGAPPAAIRHMAFIAAWTFAGVALLLVLQLSLRALRTVLQDEAYPPPALAAGLALFLFLHVRVLLLEVGRWAYLWASHAPERFDRTWRMEARALFWGAIGLTGAGAIIGAMIPLRSGALSFLLVPIAVAFVPVYETWLSPWLQFWRAGRLADTPHAELDAWLARLTKERRLPPFHVRIHEGLEKNAYAIGGMFRNLVVVGGGLVAGLTTRQLQAILAHEIAHVVRRDVLKLLATIIAGGTCHAAVLINFVNPNVDSIPAGPLIAPLYVGVAFSLACFVLPGIVSRRLEFGADRLAAELLRDPQAMVSALERVYELRGTPLDKKSLTHPTGNDRLRALRELAPSRSEA